MRNEYLVIGPESKLCLMESRSAQRFRLQYGEGLLKALAGPLGEYATDLQAGLDLAFSEVMQALRSMSERQGQAGDSFREAGRLPDPTTALQDFLSGKEHPEALGRLREFGAVLAGAWFGTGESAAIDRIATRAGLKSSSSATLLRVTALVVYSMIRKEYGEKPGRRALAEFLGNDVQPSSQATVAALETNTGQGTSIAGSQVRHNADHSATQGRSLLQAGLWTVLILATLVLLVLTEKGC